VSRRTVGFAVFSLVAIASAWLYIASRSTGSAVAVDQDASDEHSRAAASTASPERLRSAPHVYFSSTRSNEFGYVVIASLDRPNEQRFVTDLKCDRIDFAVDRGVCLVDNRINVLPPGIARIVDRDMKTLFTLDLPGFPSRTRISPDERYAATTVFVSGESYTGDFATRTYILSLQSGELLGDLERFTTWRDGKKFSAVDFNFWGVTFTKDSNRFYATLATGGKIYLVEGNVAERSMRVVRQTVECPALSPDEKHIAFKSRQPNGVEWRLHVLDLETMKEWPIASEGRSIDDQVEWLDNDHVLYHFAEERGLPEVAVNVWASPIAPGSGEGRTLFIRGGLSPAVVRPVPQPTDRQAQ
jgi:hypothetical protein